MTTILVTGAAGFIGFHLSRRLLSLGYQVIGADNINEYYDVRLKRERLRILKNHPQFTFYLVDLTNRENLNHLFAENSVDVVVNLAAQAGVRYSLEDPHSYVQSNLVGFMNVLEACRHYEVKHLIYASSSSVYGANQNLPYSTKDCVDFPINIYAATKKANELMAHSYSHLYQLPTTGLRFFTVYGPWGRPDMAYYTFTKSIIEGKPIKVFNYGDMERDFTYIDDIIEGITRLLELPPEPQPLLVDKMSSSGAPYKIYNIGNNKPVKLIEFIQVLESLIGQKAIIESLPMQPGDMRVTYAEIDDLQADTGFYPATPIEEGLSRFVKWYKEWNKEWNKTD
ncbi:NAD-dependent epimerase [Neobacillus mesonae]|uniref:Capsular biosynthesis protein CpsI n=1 Tax=Neobacillus mesonae TaxID=1193713 RepID=A0A3T0HXQ4_9BACI|nr:NAD-dependent epimerase [Neobacillus mesonae]AZU61863.1 capsular biosynthesis protein CpsI [Neobacillus mesonae]